MTLKEFRETSRMRAYSDHARKYELLIEAPSMLALLDYVDALEGIAQSVIEECRYGEYLELVEAASTALAKGEVEIWHSMN